MQYTKNVVLSHKNYIHCFNVIVNYKFKTNACEIRFHCYFQNKFIPYVNPPKYVQILLTLTEIAVGS